MRKIDTSTGQKLLKKKSKNKDIKVVEKLLTHYVFTQQTYSLNGMGYMLESKKNQNQKIFISDYS